MKNVLSAIGLDNLDFAILDELQVNGRISVADLARKIHLSQPAVHNRIKRLERQGLIRQYVALLDREMLGYDVMAFIQIGVNQHSTEQMQQLMERFAALPEVLECYRMAGEFDLMLKVVLQSTKSLDQFIAKHLANVQGIGRIQTNLVLNEAKITTALKVK